MAECGADVAAVRARKASLKAEDIRAWVEIHIEQAPQLIEAGRSVAIGTGVPGNFRYPEIAIHGEWAHVGLPRRFRHDAVLAASDFALGLDEIWKAADAAGRPMAFTIGRFATDAREHALTKVAGLMTLSLDVRAYDRAHLAALEAETLALVRAIEARRGVRFDLGKRASADVAPSDPGLLRDLTDAAAEARYRDDATREPGLARHRDVHERGRAVLHAVRAQRQRQPQSARSDGDRRFPRRRRDPERLARSHGRGLSQRCGAARDVPRPNDLPVPSRAAAPCSGRAPGAFMGPNLGRTGTGGSVARRRARAEDAGEDGSSGAAGRRSLRPLLALKPYILRHPGMLVLAGVAMVVSALAMLSVPLAVRRMIDFGFSGNDGGFIDRYFAVLVLIGVVLAGASAARFYFVNWLGERVVADVQVGRVPAPDDARPGFP